MPPPNLSNPPSETPNKEQTYTLLLFASASSFTSTSTLSLPAPSNLYSCITHLETQYPGIGNKILRSSQVVINFEYVDCEISGVVDCVLDNIKKEEEEEEGLGLGGGEGGKGKEEKREGEDVVIKAGDEVGVVPPVSAG